MHHNEKHLQKEKTSKVCHDKIHQQLKSDAMRNVMLEGILKEEDCDDENVCEFLKLVAVGKTTR